MTSVQEEWLEKLAFVEFAQNNGVYHALCMSPFEVPYGCNPETQGALIWDKSSIVRVLAVTERAKSMQDTHETLTEQWA